MWQLLFHMQKLRQEAWLVPYFFNFYLFSAQLILNLWFQSTTTLWCKERKKVFSCITIKQELMGFFDSLKMRFSCLWMPAYALKCFAVNDLAFQPKMLLYLVSNSLIVCRIACFWSHIVMINVTSVCDERQIYFQG